MKYQISIFKGDNFSDFQREVLNIACTNCYNSLAIHALCPISNGYTLLSSLIDWFAKLNVYQT